jgi:hypothetical protein
MEESTKLSLSSSYEGEMSMDGMPSNIQDKYTILKLNEKIKNLNGNNAKLNRQMEHAREVIIQHIVGDSRASANTKAFRHVELYKLIQVLIRRPPEIKYIQERYQHQQQQGKQSSLHHKEKQKTKINDKNNAVKNEKNTVKKKVPLHIRLREKYKVKAKSKTTPGEEKVEMEILPLPPATTDQISTASAKLPESSSTSWELKALKKSEQNVIELNEKNQKLELEMNHLKLLLPSAVILNSVDKKLRVKPLY